MQQKGKYNTLNTTLVTCPYCGYEDNDSWEIHHNEGDLDCGMCGEKFHFEREVTVTYSTYKKRCDSNKHEFVLASDTPYFVIKHAPKVVDGFKIKFGILDVSGWTYHKTEICRLCDEERIVDISEMEYDLGVSEYKKFN